MNQAHAQRLTSHCCPTRRSPASYRSCVRPVHGVRHAPQEPLRPDPGPQSRGVRESGSTPVTPRSNSGGLCGRCQSPWSRWTPSRRPVRSAGVGTPTSARLSDSQSAEIDRLDSARCRSSSSHRDDPPTGRAERRWMTCGSSARRECQRPDGWRWRHLPPWSPAKMVYGDQVPLLPAPAPGSSPSEDRDAGPESAVSSRR
jgi:hypothetical protein